MSEYERQQMRDKCQRLIDMGVNVVVNHGLLYTVAEQFFAEHNVIYVSNASFDLTKRIALATGAHIVSDLDSVAPESVRPHMYFITYSHVFQ